MTAIGNELQALVVGSLLGALMGQRHLAVDVAPEVDEVGNYQPAFFVTGRESGTRLRVRVDVVEPPEPRERGEVFDSKLEQELFGS